MKEEILKKWEDEIQNYPKLRIDEVRDMYLSYEKESDPNKKTEIRNKMIEGTLYIVINYIKNSIYSKIRTNVYDINDIINTFVLSWGESICSDKVLSAQGFSAIYSSLPFGNSICENLTGRKSIIDNDFSVVSDVLLKQLNIYIKMLQESPKEEYESDIDYFYEKTFEAGCIAKYEDIKKLFSFFDSVIDIFDCDINELKIEKTNLFALKQILLNNGYDNYYNIKNVEYGKAFIRDYEKLFNLSEFRDFILNDKDVLNDRERRLLELRYGIGKNFFDSEEPLTLEETGKALGVTRERIRQIEAKVFRKLMRSPNYKKRFAETNDLKTISEKEYTDIVNSFGREVRNKVDRFYEKNGRYPQWKEIKDDMTSSNIKANFVRISLDGSIDIPSLYINGVEHRNIPFRSSLYHENDDRDELNKDKNANNIEYQNYNHERNAEILNVLKDNPSFYNHLSPDQKKDIEVIKTVARSNPYYIYRDLDKFDPRIFDNEDVMLSLFMFEGIPNKLSNRLKNSSDFYIKIIKRGYYEEFNKFPKPIQINPRVVKTMLEESPETFIRYVDLNAFSNEELIHIFDYENMKKALTYSWDSVVLEKYEKYIYERNLISHDDYIDTLVKLIQDTRDKNIMNHLSSDVKFDRRFIISLADNYLYYYLTYYLDDIISKYNDDEDVMRSLVCRDVSCFDRASNRLKSSLEFIESIEKRDPEFIEDLYESEKNNYLYNFRYKIMYFTCPYTFGKNLNDVLGSSKDSFANLYKYLKLYSRDEERFVESFKRIASRQPNVVEKCPELLSDKNLMNTYLSIYPGNLYYVNNLCRKYNYEEINLNNGKVNYAEEYSEYDNVMTGYAKKGILFAQKNGLYGVINTDREIIVPFENERYSQAWEKWKQMNFTNKPVIKETVNIDDGATPYDQISLVDLKDYTKLSVLKELRDKGIINLKQILELDKISIDKYFSSSPNCYQIIQFINLMTCKYLNIYPFSAEMIYSINDVNTLYNVLGFSDELTRNLIAENFANTSVEFFNKIANKDLSSLESNLTRELLLKSQIFINYMKQNQENKPRE